VRNFLGKATHPTAPPMAGLGNDDCSFCGPGDERGIDVLKVDLHLHSSEDPVDVICHNAHQLIDRAAELGFDALALTLHDCDFRDAGLCAYARERGIVLIPGVERTIEGRHVLLLNFRERTDRVRTFEDLAELRRTGHGLVIAAHPYFPDRSCLRWRLDRYAELFDAVEWSYFWTRALNFNAQAARFAAQHGKPLVASSDLHDLRQLGRTYSLVFADRDPDSICAAIREGRVSIQTSPVPKLELARVLGGMFRRGNKTPVGIDSPAIATT
jgi:predicted metal-dependent phosphoesterase TrpH